MRKNTFTSYGSVSKFFHWTIAILAIGMLAYGYVLGYFPKNLKPVGYNIHKWIGLTILLLMILRMLWALRNPKPKLPNSTPLWEVAAERLMHFSLYIVLLAMPLAGWILASAANRPPHLFGFSLRLPVPQSERLEDIAANTHAVLAIVIIVLVSLHVLAALKHHFIDRDNILKRMLPGSKS